MCSRQERIAHLGDAIPQFGVVLLQQDHARHPTGDTARERDLLHLGDRPCAPQFHLLPGVQAEFGTGARHHGELSFEARDPQRALAPFEHDTRGIGLDIAKVGANGDRRRPREVGPPHAAAHERHQFGFDDRRGRTIEAHAQVVLVDVDASQGLARLKQGARQHGVRARLERLAPLAGFVDGEVAERHEHEVELLVRHRLGLFHVWRNGCRNVALRRPARRPTRSRRGT